MASTHLEPFQERAIAYIRAQAIKLRPDAQATLQHIYRMSNLSTTALDETKATIRKHAKVALHFHPDRPTKSSTGQVRLVARALLEDGTYKSQFETGISNGLVATHAGGLRDVWEQKLFNGAYQDEAVLPCHRPKYGALDLMRQADGPAPRFGSCYLLLKPEVSARATFTFGGSQDDPKYCGTADESDAILSALMEECFVRDCALGVENVRPAQVATYIEALKEAMPPQEVFGKMAVSRNLDHMIEAQIHGPVRLDTDVEALVADPSFRGTEIGQALDAMAERYKIPLRYHGGFALDVGAVPLDYRGSSMPSLAARVAKEGVVDTACLGAAVQALTLDPESWADRGTLEEVLQELKLLWHVLVRYGVPK
jgi:hypothetical protein